MKAIKLLFLFLLFSGAVSAQTVYRTPSGEKYHTAGCRTVKNTSKALSVSDARAAGLSPCKICKPTGNAVSNFASGGNETSGEKTTSTRCMGQTKAGTRCKHMTKIGNGYCFQHQSQQ